MVDSCDINGPVSHYLAYEELLRNIAISSLACLTSAASSGDVNKQQPGLLGDSFRRPTGALTYSLATQPLGSGAPVGCVHLY